MNHRLPPIERIPRVGDICRLGGPGGMPYTFRQRHGVGMVIKEKNGRCSVMWLKSEETMEFHKDDLILVSCVD
jgi:hypothetical protein